MKKIKFFALMSAIALTGTIGFTACSSSSDATDSTADVNPTYDGTSVRTDFAFNVTKASQGTTRMTADNTQEAGDVTKFRGMSHMYLFPFKVVPADGVETNTSTADPYTGLINNNYALGELTTSDIYADHHKKIYSLSLPVGTNNFLFYGTASRLGTQTDFEVGRLSSSFYDATGTKITTGTLTADAVKNTNDIKFSLVGIATDLGSNATALATYLSTIAQTANWAETVDIVKGTKVPMPANPDAYSSLADLYAKFTKITNDRCGSAEAIFRTVKDLYISAKAINANSSVTEVKNIANAICASIGSYTTRVEVNENNSNDPTTWNFTWTGLPDEAFPTSLKLPMGAVQLQFDATNKQFSYKSAVSPGTSIFTTGINWTKICYPSEIVYFDNSPLRATDNYKNESNYANTVTDWDKQFQNATGTDWVDTEVKPTTRAVAMTNNVNYGVSMLESTVRLETTAMTDNMSKIVNGASDQTGVSGTGMEVTGILIGGQPATVGWNMIPVSGDKYENVIYDNDVQYHKGSVTKLSTTATDKNFTVVLDNYATTTQKDVNFALQIKNGDTDFYGAYGMIPAGSTFYLVGQLKVSDGTGRVRPKVYSAGGASEIWRTASEYRITNETTDRVFLQDYKTVANITLTADALKKAYSSVPDLRSTELLFGLSVDLKWEQGLIFNVNL